MPLRFASLHADPTVRLVPVESAICDPPAASQARVPSPLKRTDSTSPICCTASSQSFASSGLEADSTATADHVLPAFVLR